MDKGSSGDKTSRIPIIRRKKAPKAAPETPESRAAEDLTVAEFYQKDGNYKGAYDRAKDAVQYQPNDPYGHFALAEAARKLGKFDEAKTEYEAVLEAGPDSVADEGDEAGVVGDGGEVGLLVPVVARAAGEQATTTTEADPLRG